MPTYDYKCSDCEHIQEEIHPMNGPLEPIICTKCGSKTLDKLIGAPYAKFVGDWQTNEVRNIK